MAETSNAAGTTDLHAQVQAALSADIHLLGDLLGAIIRRLAGDAAFALEEDVRAAAKALRAAPSVDEARKLRDRLDGLNLPELRTLIRAFSLYFDLVNLAEQQARVRSNRLRALHRAPLPLEESPEAALLELRAQGISAERVRGLLERGLIGCVFTAHPSEARRRTVLEKLAAVARRLDRRERTRLLPREEEVAVAAIAEELESLWLTSTVRGKRPAVLDEVRQGLELVENSLLEVVPRVYRELETALPRVFPELTTQRAEELAQPPVGTVPPLLRFGSWIGGDRDGHPDVTHDVTAAAIRLQQETILRHYRKLVRKLGQQLSHSRQFVAPAEEFTASLARDAERLGAGFDSLADEPYRAKCGSIALKLRRTLVYVRSSRPHWGLEAKRPPAGVYTRRQELLDDLESIAADLRAVGAEAASLGAVHDLIRLAQVFGVHMLSLDIRQHADVHARALEEILAWAGVCSGYTKLTANQRFDCLVQELEKSRPLLPARLPFSPETNEVVETFRTVAAVLERQCPEAVETYIISGATEPAHLLEVLLLAREARLFQPQEGTSRLNIVPLFESLAPLRDAATIVNRLLALPVY
ncbi:MAG: phosphoenolpyruvate carboxylase, partial [Planctomycetia bacterium]|nr:phosphoenolpyruvate carboxylase [Planctomycetia bacterium]